MGIDRRERDEWHTRIEAMMDEYREAQRRRVIKRAMALWRQAEAARRAKMYAEPQLPGTVH